ncbi:MAG: Spy/CpxP family protein refolding chaperone [candidate division WOR-3 bacterium]|jgi:Spy/CpxP family protein refolding chaperone
MNRTLKTAPLLLLAGLLFVAGTIYAQEKAEAPAPMPVMAPPMPQLTDAQREQIQNLRLKHLKEILPLETDLRIKQLELATLWTADKLDPKAIIAKVKELNELKNKLELTRVNHRLEIAQLLTPEQRKQMWNILGPGMGMGMGRRMKYRHRMIPADQLGPQEPNCCPQK